MKLVAGFFVLLLISGISMVSAASIISIELDSDTLVAGEIVEITGTVESSLAGQPVGIEVKDSDGKIILIRSITSDSNGNFTLEFKVPSSASGNIEIMSSVEIDGQSFSESVSATVAVPELFEEESIAEPISEPTTKSEASQSSEGCGAGTVMVNGVCQVAKTSGTSMAIEPMYIVIAAVAVGGGAVGAIFAVKKGSKTPKPAKQELEKYEEKYLAKPKRKPKPAKKKPAEKKETSSSCSNCGNTLNPKAKFCGGCGTKV